MKFEKLEVGMILFDVHSYKMGNTKLSTLGVWRVSVREIDVEKRRALCSWNGNTATWCYESKLSKLKDKEPYLVKTNYGIKRRPTKEELAEYNSLQKAKAAEQKGAAQ